MKNKSSVDTALKTVFGPLWKIYSDDSISTICIDSYHDVYYMQWNDSKTDAKIFSSARDLDAFIGRIIKYAGKKPGELSKSFFLNLNEYTKIHIVLPPIAVRGPSILISKIPKQNITMDDLVRFKSLDEEGKTLCLKLIKEGKGILVAGLPGSGKTTILNTFVNAIPQPKRVVTIERYADLIVDRSKVCRLQTSNQKAEEMVELVTIAESMFPDYLVISNFEGAEVMPFLEVVRSNCSAMGLITGENPMDALKRLETKAVLSSEGMSLEDARYAISQAFSYVVFQERRDPKTRLITSIGEIGYDAGELKLKIIYKR